MAGLGFLILAGLYFLPTIIAASRSKRNTIAIGALNFFFGWSFIGWIVALIWALSADPPAYQHVINVSQNVGMPPYYPQQGMPPYYPPQQGMPTPQQQPGRSGVPQPMPYYAPPPPYPQPPQQTDLTQYYEPPTN